MMTLVSRRCGAGCTARPTTLDPITGSHHQRYHTGLKLNHLGLYTLNAASVTFVRMPDLAALGLEPGVTGGWFVIEFGWVCYQDTYPMYLARIVHVSCMRIS
jgi:hypothetical protein